MEVASKNKTANAHTSQTAKGKKVLGFDIKQPTKGKKK